MAVTGEQIRREQEESRRRSKLSQDGQLAPPVPPPWDEVWRKQKRTDRLAWVVLLAGLVGMFTAAALIESFYPNRDITYVFAALGSFMLLMAVNRHAALICPRCGHRYWLGRSPRRACQNCRLPYGSNA